MYDFRLNTLCRFFMTDELPIILMSQGLPCPWSVKHQASDVRYHFITNVPLKGTINFFFIKCN